MTAQIPAAAARPHPASRHGMADSGAGTATDSTKASITAGPPAAKYPLMTPENRIANPTTAMAAAASQGFCEQTVPTTTSTAPATARLR